jgi:hypothetical protein
MERLRAIEASGWEKIEDYGRASHQDSDEVLRMVQQTIRAQPNREEQATGMCLEFSTQDALLDFLLCLAAACNGAANRSGFEKASYEVRSRIVRGLWVRGTTCRSPHRRQPVEQCGSKSSDPLLALSFVLARHAAAYREEAGKAHAASGRTGMLRAYGNAIVPQVAAEFIRAFGEVTNAD